MVKLNQIANHILNKKNVLCNAQKFCYLCGGLVVQRIEREIPNFQMGVRFPPGLQEGALVRLFFVGWGIEPNGRLRCLFIDNQKINKEMAEAKSIRGTRTEKNLAVSYMNESAAYTRYNYYAKQATKESLFPIAQVFSATAENEFAHSKVFFKMLQGGKVTIDLNPDAGVIGTTAENLKTAMSEELAEGVDAYLDFAKVAREEGFPEIASHFEAIAKVEQHHYDRFGRYLEMLNNGTLWKREKPIKWQCLVCGYIVEGTEPPKVCPGCDHPYQHYMALDDYNDIVLPETAI